MFGRRRYKIARRRGSLSRNTNMRTIRAPKDTKPLKTLFKALVLSGALASLIYYFLFSSAYQINSITVTGTKSLSNNKVKETVKNITEKGVNNIWLFSARSAKKQLLKTYGEIKTLEIKKKPPHGLDVKIVERTASIVWLTGEKRYFLDVDGVATAEISSDSTALAAVSDSANLPVKVGDKIVSKSFITFANAIKYDLKPKTGLEPKSMSVPETISELYVATDKGYTLKFDTARQAGQQIDQLKKVLAQLNKEQAAPREYIDLRIENKSFYK